MSKKEPPSCVRCRKKAGENDKFCTDCGSPLFNRCSDEPGILKKGCSHLNEPDAAFCARCGEQTVFQMHGLITPFYTNGNKPAFVKSIFGDDRFETKART
jgi:hypothetical protein